MANTAIRAIKEMNTRTVTFKSREHEKFYQKYLPRCRYQDEYHLWSQCCKCRSE